MGGVWDCAIDGRPFRFDRNSDGFKQGIQSISVLRTQSDTSDRPGEGSINREDSWRSGQSSWHKGAGQRYRDKENADPDRFWASQGVDVWTRDQLSLLHDTTIWQTTTAAKTKTLVVGDYLYFAHGDKILRTTDGSNQWQDTSISTGGQNVIDLATNGSSIWAVCDGNKTFTSTVGSTTWTAWLTGTYENVTYARGRLILSNAQNIFEVRSTTATSLNPSEGNTALRWTAVCEGNAAIFAAGTTGDRSQIYKLTPNAEDPTAALGVPTQASPQLPTGEIVTALYGYLGQIVIGTNKGVRVADEDGNGNLNIGALIELPSPVHALEGDGKFVWFAWSNADVDKTGLGRLDLSIQTEVGVFAYASDIMAADQGTVTSISSLNGKRVFAVQSKGLYGETNSFVSSGWLDSGLIRYGIIDEKVARRVELRHRKLSGSIGVELSVNEDTFRSLGVSSLEGTITPTIGFTSSLAAGSSHEVRLVLTKGATGSPVVQSVELRADPVPQRAVTIWVAVMLSERDPAYEGRHPLDDYEALVGLANVRRAVTYQLDSKVFSITVQEFQFIPTNKTTDSRFENGTMILKLKAAA